MGRKQRAKASANRSICSTVCLAGLSFLPLACANSGESVVTNPTPARPSIVRAAPAAELQLVKADGPDKPERLPDPVHPPTADAPVVVHPVLLTLGTIFRLAEDQNSQIALSRARIDEAYASKELADRAWLPQISFGGAWWRHEGGITNQDGTLQRSSFGALLAGGSLAGKLDLKDAIYQQFVAERQVWQQRGESSKVTTETLLDAANTYVDLLAARTGEAMALESKAQLQTLLEKAEKATTALPGASIEVARIKATLRGREMLIAQLQQQAARASAKLIYLLGIDPCSTIAIADDHLVPLDLIDPARPVCDLVKLALTNGPGIQEMERMLALIEDATNKANGPAKYLPIVEANMLEGGYGSGPGASTSWDNRFDLALQVRWDLTQLLTQNERSHLIRARTEQANLSYRDLRAKLTAGVQEAWEITSRGRQELSLGEAAIASAKEALKLSEDRMNANIQGTTYSEIMQSQQAVATARASYMSAVRNYNQAQLRLFLLTGSMPLGGPAVMNCPSTGHKQE